MRFIMGGINGQYLRNITENAADETQEVLAAVAYATESSLLFEWCWKNSIPIKYYGRLDDGVAVTTTILSTFLSRRSPNFSCRLVQHHHAKVIWWRGFGAYIGSANLTQSAWYKNVEAGCFFPEAEIDDEMASDILSLFSTLEANSTPLTDELLEVMRKRAKTIAGAKTDPKQFWQSPSFTKWPGLVQTAPKKAKDRKRQDFLEEWHSTLQDLRDIGERVSRLENRPGWINSEAPAGAQADQFLHAHYYQRTFDGRKAQYPMFYEKNKLRREEALTEAIEWWGKLPTAPSEESKMLNDTAPFLQKVLSQSSLSTLNYSTFKKICI